MKLKKLNLTEFKGFELKNTGLINGGLAAFSSFATCTLTKCVRVGCEDVCEDEESDPDPK